MDWTNPGIGLGKAGNNPYSWLAAGAAGLQSMLADKTTYDPRSMENEEFARAGTAEALDPSGGNQSPFQFKFMPNGSFWLVFKHG